MQEQRLRYLKQQERRQQQAVSESEKLQRLKERVESQEAKLKKIRAMRGQVDYSKVINGNLCECPSPKREKKTCSSPIQRTFSNRQFTPKVSAAPNAAPLPSAAAEIEQVSSLFQEKQVELQSAVLRVEQLSLQLEDLRRGKINGVQGGLGGQMTGAAALELRKLYQELQVRLEE